MRGLASGSSSNVETIDLTVGDDNTIHTVPSFQEEVPHATGAVPCHVCHHVIMNGNIDDYCGVCCRPTHVDTTCYECLEQHPGRDINSCAMVISCCDEHIQAVCVQCLARTSSEEILAVYRNMLRRAGITRHPNAVALGFGPIPISLELDDSEGPPDSEGDEGSD